MVPALCLGRIGPLVVGAAILTGGLFTGAYLFRVFAAAFARPAGPLATPARAASREAVVLALALLSLGLGLLPLPSLGLVQIGRWPMAVSP